MKGRIAPIPGMAMIIAAALAASACGNGGPSSEEFRQQAGEICREHRANIEQEASEVLAGGELPSPREFGKLVNETIIPETRAQFEELADVEPPDELADDFNSFVEQGREAVEEIQQNPMVIQDPAAFQELKQQAEELGLDACRVGAG